MNSRKLISLYFIILLSGVFCFGRNALAATPGGEYEEVDWHMTGNRRVKGIRYPKPQKPLLVEKELSLPAAPTAITSTTISANIIDSPPIAGFVPWIAVGTTDAKGEELDFAASRAPGITGNVTANLKTNYAIGIYDTGASAHIMGYNAATQLGLFNPDPANDLITNNVIYITGVTGSVEASVSYPLGIFVDGLAAIDPCELLDTSGMVGETNVAIVVGQNPGGNIDLPTAIGVPLSLYYTAVFLTDQPKTITRNGEKFTAPNIGIYEHDDSRVPKYPNTIPLELRPLGGLSVQYVPDFNLFGTLNDLDLEDLLNISFDIPASPSIVMGNLAQSVFFVHSVDISDSGNTASDKDRFMLDTGAQVSVIGSRIAARLGLDANNPDFEVLIQGVTGTDSNEPGFFIDSVNIPGMGQWLRFTNVPVVLLDVFSPEGGTLDGIIGMNLFTEFNFALRGGGLFLDNDPVIKFAHIDDTGIIGDIAPGDGDGMVNIVDLAVLAQAWFATSTPTPASNWNPKCDLAPDGKIDQLDFAVMSGQWLEGTAP